MTESPIQNPDRVDVFGERKDGGADLLISVSGPLDSSPETLMLLTTKIKAYITAVASEGFQRRYIAGNSKIAVSCAFPVSEAAHRVVDDLIPLASQCGVSLQFR